MKNIINETCPANNLKISNKFYNCQACEKERTRKRIQGGKILRKKTNHAAQLTDYKFHARLQDFENSIDHVPRFRAGQIKPRKSPQGCDEGEKETGI